MSRLLDLRLPADLAAWRAEVSEFLRDEMLPDRTAGHGDETDLTGLDETFERAHQRAAAARGYLAISLPTADGGGGRSRSWKLVYDLEAAYHDAPSIDTGVTLCGMPLSMLGTAEQKRRWLAPMVDGEIGGAIAYTEAHAGNDLAMLTTTARRGRHRWTLSGAKALVTGAHKAAVAIVLAITDPEGSPRHSMSMFLVPTDAPGVTIVRRPTLNRWTLSEVTFDAVELPPDSLLGEEGRGWQQVLAGVAAERGSLAHLGWAARAVENLPAGTDLRDRAKLHVGLSRARYFYQRLLDITAEGGGVGHEGSVAKVVGTELLQEVAKVAMTSAPQGQTEWRPLFGAGRSLAYDALEWIHPTISVGANETHRDMIAATLLADESAALEPYLGESGSDGSLAAQCIAMARDAREVLQLTVARTRERALFGQTVSDFQVARHRLVDMAIAVESMELAIDDLARADTGPERGYHESVTKVICNDAVLDVTASGHQLCGGEGYYADHPLAAYTRRAWSSQAERGTTPHHLDLLADQIN